MKTVKNTAVLKRAALALAFFVLLGGKTIQSQLTTGFFTPESFCSIIDQNNFAMTNGLNTVGAARYNYGIPLSSHIELETHVKFLGLGSAGYVVGNVSSVPLYSLLAPNGGWPASDGRIIVRLNDNLLSSNLSLSVDGTTIWSNTMPPLIFGSCHALKLRMVPTDAGIIGKIQLYFDDVLVANHQTDYKNTVFGGAATTTLRIWGVSLATTPAFVSLNGACVETLLRQAGPTGADKPKAAYASKRANKPMAIAAAGLVAFATGIAQGIFNGGHPAIEKSLMRVRR